MQRLVLEELFSDTLSLDQLASLTLIGQEATFMLTNQGTPSASVSFEIEFRLAVFKACAAAVDARRAIKELASHGKLARQRYEADVQGRKLDKARNACMVMDNAAWWESLSKELEEDHQDFAKMLEENWPIFKDAHYGLIQDTIDYALGVQIAALTQATDKLFDKNLTEWKEDLGESCDLDGLMEVAATTILATGYGAEVEKLMKAAEEVSLQILQCRSGIRPLT